MDDDCRMEASVPLIAAVQLQTIDMCNRSCDFCPNKFGLRKTGAQMEEAMLLRILNCLGDMNFKGRISPYLMNEPLLDSRLPRWIALIRERFPQNVIFLNSNGDAIGSQSLQNALANAGLDGLQINCYDNEQHFGEITKLVECWSKRDDRVLVHHSGSLRLLRGRNGRVNVRVKWIPAALPAFWNRAGHVTSVVPQGKYQGLAKCTFPFEQLYINYRGHVILCCCDYRFEVVLGNIAHTPLSAIWDGPGYWRYRTGHENGNVHDLLLCKSCNRVSKPSRCNQAVP